MEMIEMEIEQVVMFHTASDEESTWNIDEIYEVMNTIFPIPLQVRLKLVDIQEAAGDASQDSKARSKIINYLIELATRQYDKLSENINRNQILREQTGGIEPMYLIEKMILLRSIDLFWVEHIDALDHLRQGIGLRGYGQRDPLVEYKKEAYRMFIELQNNIRRHVVYSIFKVGLVSSENLPAESVAPTTRSDNRNLQMKGAAKTSDEVKSFAVSPEITPQKTGLVNASKLASHGAVSSTIMAAPVEIKKKKVGRNEPCPCGSGKKFKKCHGR
jgi:preprotein translocase subunit SecA